MSQLTHPSTAPAPVGLDTVINGDDATQRPSVVSDDDCIALLQTTTIGRIAFASVDDGIQVLPVNFILRDGRIYLRTDPNGIVAEVLGTDADVAFEVDHHDDLFQLGWSVLVHGPTKLIENQDTIAGGLSGGRPAPWAPGERPLIIELKPRTITGRRVKKRDKNWQT